jgi:hypothetical protein
MKWLLVLMEAGEVVFGSRTAKAVVCLKPDFPPTGMDTPHQGEPVGQ